MQSGAMDPGCMHGGPRSVNKRNPIDGSQVQAAFLNGEDSMQCGAMDPNGMKGSQCSEAKSSRLNAVDYMEHGPIHPD